MEFTLSEYQQDLVATLRRLGEKRLAPDGFVPPSGPLPRAYLELLSKQGLAGITIPEENGGQGGQLLDAVLAIETLAQYSAAAGDALQALNFGGVQQIARHGTPEQRDCFLRPILAGDEVVCMGMTEPDAGSAVTDLRTTARRDGDCVVLNGRKIFSTHGDSAGIFVIWARFGVGARSTGAVLVRRDTPGFSVDASHGWMSGERYGMTYMDGCRVPAENVLLWENGFSKMLTVFNIERLGNAGRSLAYAQAAFDRALEYARDRRQFGRRLAEFQGLQWRFAEMKLKIDSARLLLYRAASNVDVGTPSPLDASLAKLACNRAGFEVANAALQVLGGYGYEEESAINYMFRRTRGWLIAGGTEEQMLNRIASEVFGERFSQRPLQPVVANGAR